MKAQGCPTHTSQPCWRRTWRWPSRWWWWGTERSGSPVWSSDTARASSRRTTKRPSGLTFWKDRSCKHAFTLQSSRVEMCRSLVSMFEPYCSAVICRWTTLRLAALKCHPGYLDEENNFFRNQIIQDDVWMLSLLMRSIFAHFLCRILEWSSVFVQWVV